MHDLFDYGLSIEEQNQLWAYCIQILNTLPGYDFEVNEELTQSLFLYILTKCREVKKTRKSMFKTCVIVHGIALGSLALITLSPIENKLGWGIAVTISAVVVTALVCLNKGMKISEIQQEMGDKIAQLIEQINEYTGFTQDPADGINWF